MSKKIIVKAKQIWKSGNKFHMKILCIGGLVIGGAIGKIRLFIAKQQLNKIGRKFDENKDEWVRILSSYCYYNEEIYLKVRELFCDKIIARYFEPYIMGDINYKKLKTNKKEIVNNLSKIYREVLEEMK